MSFHRLLEFISWFRVIYADRPFWLFVACLIVLTIAGLLRKPLTQVARRASTLTVGLALAAIAIYVAIVIWYFFLPTFFDYAEPTMAAVGWLFAIGQPIYHAPDAAARYSHMYGPLAFMIPGWSLEIFGPGLWQSKLPGLAAGLLSVILVYVLARSSTGSMNAIVLTGLFSIELLMFRNLAFWIRPDSFLLLFVAVGLFATMLSSPIVATLILGLSIGVLLNLKLTGVLYALPAIGLFAARHGVKPLLLVGATALVLVFWPFLLFENVSFTNFRYWTQVSAANGLGFITLRANIEWALFLLVPLVPVLLAAPDSPDAQPRRWGLAGLAAGVVGVVIAGAKPGAGPYHLMPFLPAVFYLLALGIDAVPYQVRRQLACRQGPLVVAVTALMIAICQQTFFLIGSTVTARMDLAGDLTRFADRHPGARLAMGYTEVGERLTFVRPILVFRSGSYPLDGPAVQEYQMSGLTLPVATYQALEGCKTDFWFFPKGAAPFSALNIYPSMQRRLLFPDPFRETFARHYEHGEDTHYFQVWRCRDGARVIDR
jgi:hypothetical protein